MDWLDRDQVARVFAKLLLATRRGKLAWEEDLQKRCLYAPLDNEYVVELRQIPDLRGESDEPDHRVALVQDSSEVLSFTREDVTEESLSGALSERIDYPYQLFKELWDRALNDARKVSEHLARVSVLLDQVDKNQDQ